MMRVYVEDTGLELVVELSATGGYAPDMMDDLGARSIAMFQQACATKLAVADAAERGQE